MDLKEVQDLIKALRECGVTQYKTPELSLELGPLPVVAPVPEITAEIKHKVEEMKSLMKLSDAELVDSLFPEPREESAE